MGIFTAIFHPENEEARLLDSALDSLKKVLEKVLSGIVDLDEEFWGLESSVPVGRKGVKIIPEVYRNYGKLKKFLWELKGKEEKAKELLQDYEKGMKASNPRGFVIAKRLIEDFFFNIRISSEAIEDEMKMASEAIVYLKELRYPNREMMKNFHIIVDNYDEKEKNIQHYIKNIYHEIVKLEKWGRRYVSPPAGHELGFNRLRKREYGGPAEKRAA